MKNPQKMTMSEIRLAIELLEDEILAGRPADLYRLAELRVERTKRIKAGLASIK